MFKKSLLIISLISIIFAGEHISLNSQKLSNSKEDKIASSFIKTHGVSAEYIKDLEKGELENDEFDGINNPKKGSIEWLIEPYYNE